MAKKKVTVNIEEKVWEGFKQAAWKSQLEAGQNLSVSQYLENMISVKLTLPVAKREKRIRDYSVGGKDEQTEIKVGFEDTS